uniref:hypothetical protein n=1 Tax=Halomonas sp. TaxID=1486246 RepID=UPI003569357C
MTETAKLRTAMLAALPFDTSLSGATPSLERLYVPPTHLKALRPECQLVVGTRGVGKSVWTAALGNTALRHTLGSSVPELDQATIRIGFAERPSLEHYPDADTLISLIEAGRDPYQIWRAVIVSWAAELASRPLPRSSWESTVEWLTDNPEDVAQLMQEASQEQTRQQRYGLILFDALDRVSGDWAQMDQVVRALLRAVLWLKAYPRLSAKVFLREDQLERTVSDFPDASKLLATQAELSWAHHDLHGLLWQHLINAPDEHGDCLRDAYAGVVGSLPPYRERHHELHDDAKRDSHVQRRLFALLAGPWMGRDRRRGVPYTWIVSHLADGQARTSPRSFLAAIRQAAEDTAERYPKHSYALHYESIKRGVRKASEIRVNELAEDYAWVKGVLIPLAGLSVPIAFETIRQQWESRFPGGVDSVSTAGQLPPQHQALGWNGVKDDLLRVGIFEQRRDGRIDMPDLYRVGFGLGRKGGIKPRSRP